MLIAKIIECIHYFITGYILILPFTTKDLDLLLIHWLVLTVILVHWLTNNSACVLTEIEHRLRATDGRQHDRNETFMHRVLSPFFTPSFNSSAYAYMDVMFIKLTIIFYLICSINLTSTI